MASVPRLCPIGTTTLSAGHAEIMHVLPPPHVRYVRIGQRNFGKKNPNVFIVLHRLEPSSRGVRLPPRFLKMVLEGVVLPMYLQKVLERTLHLCSEVAHQFGLQLSRPQKLAILTSYSRVCPLQLVKTRCRAVMASQTGILPVAALVLTVKSQWIRT